MKKNIKDYLHLYLGCESEIGTIIGVTSGKSKVVNKSIELLDVDRLFKHSKGWVDIKPILRPLSDMTVQDKIDIANELGIATENAVTWMELAIKGRTGYFGTQVGLVNALRKRFFDCDGLIEAGLAIDKTIKTPFNHGK